MSEYPEGADVRHVTSLDGKRLLVLAEATDQPLYAVWTGGRCLGSVQALSRRPYAGRAEVSWHALDTRGNTQHVAYTVEEAAQGLDAWALRTFGVRR